MSSSDGSFLTGFVLGGAISFLFYMNVDINFDKSEAKNIKFIEICGKYNSRPESYDMFELTCSNGLNLKYDSIELP